MDASLQWLQHADSMHQKVNKVWFSSLTGTGVVVTWIGNKTQAQSPAASDGSNVISSKDENPN